MSPGASRAPRRSTTSRPAPRRYERAPALPRPDEPQHTYDDVHALEIAAEGLERLSGEERRRAFELIVREARAISGYLTRIA